MEKHFYQGVAFLLILLGLSIFAAWGMVHIHETAETQLSQAAQLALEGDADDAVQLANQAHSWWERTRNLTAALADHQPLDDVDSLFAQMEVYAASEEYSHFAVCCNQLSALVRSIYQAHTFTWWNLL